MMNFGLSRLRLVRPDEFDAYRIGGIAHRSAAWTESAELFDTLDDALADATFIVGTTARARTAGRSYARPRDVARTVAARVGGGRSEPVGGRSVPVGGPASPAAGDPRADPTGRGEGPGGAVPVARHTVALVFGREDRGLTNEALDRCHAVTIIPTDPDYPSLNLAQACLLLAYEVYLAVGGGEETLPRGRRSTRPPTQAELEETYAALEQGLARIEFYKARKPAAVMRTLRTLVARAEPDLREARLLAAIGYEIGHHIDRITGA
jgi:tRNA C32,U32 (ribose-2'-O)-methylase TrmJ